MENAHSVYFNLLPILLHYHLVLAPNMSLKYELFTSVKVTLNVHVLTCLDVRGLF